MGLLIYYRFYTMHLFIGSLFGVDDSTICRRFAVLESLVVGAVALKKDRTRRQDDLETLLIDATEQPIERPVRGQRRFYSGKKKRHTLKIEVQVTEAGRIVAISKPFPGACPRHRGAPPRAAAAGMVARLRGQRIPGLAETPRADGTTLQAAKGSATQRRREGLQPRPPFALHRHRQLDVGAVEAEHKGFHLAAEQALGDILAGHFVGGRRQRGDGNPGEELPQPA